NDGYYQLSGWGPFDSQWVLARERDIASSLGFRA
ncbi:helix-turn-helix domain-containing protein, partial [Vibrio sp. 2089]